MIFLYNLYFFQIEQRFDVTNNRYVAFGENIDDNTAVISYKVFYTKMTIRISNLVVNQIPYRNSQYFEKYQEKNKFLKSFFSFLDLFKDIFLN